MDWLMMFLCVLGLALIYLAVFGLAVSSGRISREEEVSATDEIIKKWHEAQSKSK